MYIIVQEIKLIRILEIYRDMHHLRMRTLSNRITHITHHVRHRNVSDIRTHKVENMREICAQEVVTTMRELRSFNDHSINLFFLVAVKNIR